MTLRRLSIICGKDEDYFGVMKGERSRERFDFIMSFNKNKLTSVKKHERYIKKLFKRVEDILYCFKNKSQFSKWLYENKIYNSKNMGAEGICKILYESTNDHLSLRVSLIRRFEKIVKLFMIETISNSFKKI